MSVIIPSHYPEACLPAWLSFNMQMFLKKANSFSYRSQPYSGEVRGQGSRPAADQQPRGCYRYKVLLKGYVAPPPLRKNPVHAPEIALLLLMHLGVISISIILISFLCSGTQYESFLRCACPPLGLCSTTIVCVSHIHLK